MSGALNPANPQIREAAELLKQIGPDEWAACADLLRDVAARPDLLSIARRQHAGQVAAVIEGMTHGVEPLATFAFLDAADASLN